MSHAIHTRSGPTVDQYRHFQRSISTDNQGRDEIDRGLDHDRVEVPWPEVNPPFRRKDSEIGRVLDILDNLPTGKEIA